MTHYIIKTQDVDGSSRQVYKTEQAAIKRFEQMQGRHPNAWQEFHERPPFIAIKPGDKTVDFVSAVSDFGTVVSIRRVPDDN